MTSKPSAERNAKGHFVKGSAAAREAGRKGGSASTGQFTKNSVRARLAGQKGGRKNKREKAA